MEALLEITMSATLTSAFDYNQISPRHRQVMRLMYLGTMTQRDIAAAVGYTQSTLSLITNQPFFQAAFNDFCRAMDAGVLDVRARFEELAPEATETLHSLMQTAQSEPLRRMCAMDILKCAGHGNTSRVSIETKGSVNISVDVASSLLDALRESRTVLGASASVKGVDSSNPPIDIEVSPLASDPPDSGS